MANYLMFSGLGSQYYNMGSTLLKKDDSFSKHMQSLDEKVRHVLGYSMLDVIYDSAKTMDNEFEQSRDAALSLFLTELSLARCVSERGIRVDGLLGASFGTFVAAVHADCLDDEAAIEVICQFGELFETRGAPGVIVAVLASPDIFFKSEELQRLSELAGDNFSNHFNLSLPERNYEQVKRYLENSGIAFFKTPINIAFHSHWIDNVKFPFFSALDSIRWRLPRLPIVSAAHRCVLNEFSTQLLWEILREPMYVRQTFDFLESTQPHFYIDAGPSATMANFLKYNVSRTSSSQYAALLDPYRREENLIDELSRHSFFSGATEFCGV